MSLGGGGLRESRVSQSLYESNDQHHLQLSLAVGYLRTQKFSTFAGCGGGVGGGGGQRGSRVSQSL